MNRVGIPTISHPTTTISGSGMVADVDMPNMAHVDAMELTIEHNNGENHVMLITPGVHTIEFRVARQKYGVKNATIAHESVKYIFTAVLKSQEDGNVEKNNPIGSTAKYSVLKMERIVAGKTELKIDAMNGIIVVDGKDYTNDIQKLLN